MIVFKKFNNLKKNEKCFNCKKIIYKYQPNYQSFYKDKIVYIHENYDICKESIQKESLKAQYRKIQDIIRISIKQNKKGNYKESYKLFLLAKRTKIIKNELTYPSKMNFENE